MGSVDYAVELLAILNRDLPRLEVIDDYLHGRHSDPYMPSSADDEYRLLARRSIDNWCPLLVDTPAQALYVDGFRRGDGSDTSGIPGQTAATPEWDHWQRSGMDGKQLAVHRGALGYGHSFVVTENNRRKGVTSRGLSAMNTTAIFEDPANDVTPLAALTVTKWPTAGYNDEIVAPVNIIQSSVPDDVQIIPGEAWLWDGLNKYKITFKGLGDPSSVSISSPVPHGASECPVTRFAAMVDLEGRTLGVIEPHIVIQDRINQTVFDLLVAQTYNSQVVRTVSGMAPALQRDPVTGEVLLDDLGNPIPVPINYNARRFLFAEDPEAKFGTLEGGPLAGFIESLDMQIRHLAAISQIPPHHLLGQIANLSAEALQAAETSLSRKVQEFRTSFGESWERVFRIAGELDGVSSAANDFAGEVLWRDMESRSLAQSADALGKLGQQLGIPLQGLWSRVPGVTQTELEDWKNLYDEQDSQAMLAQALNRATNPAQPNPAQPATPQAGTPTKPVTQ